MESLRESDALTSKILSVVAALTRDLRPGELSLRLAATESLPLTLDVLHHATFEALITPGKGQLPDTVKALGSLTELQTQLDERLQIVRQEAGDLIDQWLEESAAAYRSVLPPERCMIERPVLGFQEVCRGCGGRKELTCQSCSGSGRVVCPSCGGRGRVTCSSCGGSRQRSCGSCGGAGSHEVREMEVSYSDAQNTPNQQRQLTRRVPCSGCGGSGSLSCGCDGTQACSCQGGYVACGGCSGHGIIPCATCAATGIVHQTGSVRSAVDRKTGVEIGGVAEDQQTFRDRVPFDQIGRLASEPGGVRLQSQSRVDHRATLDYAATIPVEVAEAKLSDETVAIRAYGPSREIYEYHSLVTKLLEPDLVELEESLTGNGPLAGAVRQFLASEVNALIAEAAPLIQNGDGSARISLARLIGQSLVLAPPLRLFRQSGCVLRVVMILIALGLLSQFIPAYAVLVLVSLVFEWRYQRNPPPEVTGAKAVGKAAAPASDEAAKSLVGLSEAGKVSAAYVQRAASAIRNAIPKLYGPLVVPWAWGITAGATLLFLVALRILPRWSGIEKAAVLLALTGVAWLIVEHRAYASSKEIFGDKIHQRLKSVLGETRDRYRLAVAGGALLAWLVASTTLRFF